MRLLQFSASFLVLALLAGSVPLRAETTAGGTATEQQTAIPADVQALLDDKRPASELSKKELSKRIRAAKGFIQAGGLSDDVMRQLKQMLKADRQVRKSQKKTTTSTTPETTTAKPDASSDDDKDDDDM